MIGAERSNIARHGRVRSVPSAGYGKALKVQGHDLIWKLKNHAFQVFFVFLNPEHCFTFDKLGFESFYSQIYWA